MSKPGQLSLADYYSADAEALLTKYRQIEHLIGPRHHSPSDGTFCEALLKEFLRRALPGHVSVDGGFIRRVSNANWAPQANAPLPPEAPIATPQIDIIVHDTQNYAPLFRSEDFVVVLPEAVRAVIEVKRCLDWSKLSEAVTNITETTHLLRKWRSEPNRVFSGIFGFGLHDDLSPKTKLISDSFHNCYQAALDKYAGDCDLPHLTMALPKFALQQGNPPEQYNYCPTTPDDANTPNVAGQFLVFLISYFTSMGTQGRALVYPEVIPPRRQEAFRVKRP
jgi:hypothetical protein